MAWHVRSVTQVRTHNRQHTCNHGGFLWHDLQHRGRSRWAGVGAIKAAPSSSWAMLLVGTCAQGSAAYGVLWQLTASIRGTRHHECVGCAVQAVHSKGSIGRCRDACSTWCACSTVTTRPAGAVAASSADGDRASHWPKVPGRHDCGVLGGSQCACMHACMRGR